MARHTERIALFICNSQIKQLNTLLTIGLSIILLFGQIKNGVVTKFDMHLLNCIIKNALWCCTLAVPPPRTPIHLKILQVQ
jgi:hypothetical protein